MSDIVPENITLYHALRASPRRASIEDIHRQPLSFRQLLIRIEAAALPLRRVLPADDSPVGVLLPNAAITAVLLFALSRLNRATAMLNFSAGPASVHAACVTAGVRCVLTSHRLVEKAELQPLIAELEQQNIRVLYAEDLCAHRRFYDPVLVAASLIRTPPLPERAAPVILFTSGSEGVPKGAVLPPRALLANVRACMGHTRLTPEDVSFNALPLFHAFGLTGGLLLPLLAGMRTFLYPSPLHYKVIPPLLREIGATLFFSTDTFLRKYAERAGADDFRGVTRIVVGAEKLHESTRLLYLERFGAQVYQGYGVTETGPVLAFNAPGDHVPGTVGRLLPGVEARLESVEGVAEGGRLSVRGPNVMAGYLRHNAPGVLQPPPEGFHDTGDIVTLDAAGYVRIVGRAKRFAKIAGEMVSLAAVEESAAGLYPQHRHAAVSVPDEKKGERVLLLSEAPEADRAALQQHMLATGLSALHVPAAVQTCEAVPVLPTGKIDYPAVLRLLTDG